MRTPVASHRWVAPLISVCLVLSANLWTPARAERADHEKPTVIVYDHANWDDLKQVYVFTGNVVLTKGTILMRCDKLTVKQDPEGYNFAVAVMDAPDRRVFFRQKREGFADQFMEATGDRIEYDEKANEVEVYTHANVKRLDAEVLQDDMHGDTIEYNSETEKYHVEAGGEKQPRASVQIAPAKNANAPAAGATPTSKPGAPTTPHAAPGASPSDKPGAAAAPTVSNTFEGSAPTNSGSASTATPNADTHPVPLQGAPRLQSVPAQ